MTETISVKTHITEKNGVFIVFLGLHGITTKDRADKFAQAVKTRIINDLRQSGAYLGDTK